MLIYVPDFQHTKITTLGQIRRFRIGYTPDLSFLEDFDFSLAFVALAWREGLSSLLEAMRASLRSLASSVSSPSSTSSASLGAAKTRGLPPLPPISSWSTYFKRTEYPKPPDPLIREFRGRTLLATRSLCDDFVKAVKLRPGEVVIEVWPGHGQLTRSLLSGGNRQVSSPWSEEDVKAAQKAAATPPLSLAKSTFLTQTQVARRKLGETSYPEWSEDLLANRTSEDRSGQNQDTDLPRPAVVVTTESSPVLNVKSLGLPPSQILEHLDAEEKDSALPGREYEPPVKLFQSAHETRLIICPHTIYRWSTAPVILSHPLVTKRLPPNLDESGEAYEDGRRPWDAPPPHITLAGHIPINIVGEQLVAQWIGSVVGDSEGRRSWIWQWGRVRLALLMGKGLYDVRRFAPST